ncbi:MAG TPA: DUF1572 family protein, partial [Bacteroidia bacterium]|nr:DUF1572 family protein [Bacteroidia bacterium]
MSQFIQTSIKQFVYYKLLGEKTFEQLKDEQFLVCPNDQSNSIAIIVQ